MREKSQRAGKRRFYGSLDQLDDRVLLNTGPVATVTPAASVSQSDAGAAVVSPLVTAAFESAVARLNEQFITQEQALNNLVIARIEHFEGLLASNAASGEARMNRVAGRRSFARRVRVAIPTALLNAQVAHQEAFFNAKAARLTATFENQMATLSGTFQQASALFAAPSSAFLANVQSAGTAFSSELATAFTGVTSSVQNGAATLNSLFANPALASSSTSGLPSSGSLVGVLPTFPQAFNSAVTQLVGALTTNLQGMTTALQQNFGAFQTQFGTNVSTLTSSFNASPFGTFGVLPSFTMNTSGFVGLGNTGTTLNNTGVGATAATGALGTTGLSSITP